MIIPWRTRSAGRGDQYSSRALVLVFVLGLALNAAELWAHPPNPGLGDTDQWWQLVLNVLHGHGYVACYPTYFPFCGPTNQVTAAREPAPVLMFAAVASLTHESLLAAHALQLAVNLSVLLAVFCLTRQFADARVALLAALMWALYLPAIRALQELGGDLFATLGVTWGLFFFIRARRTERARDWLAAGVCIGLGALSRSAVLIIIPALITGLILWPPRMFRWRGPRTAILGSLALFTLAAGLTQSPWVARNYAVFGRVVMGSTLAPFNLYRENYMLPTEHYLRFVRGTEGQSAVQALLARRTDLQGTENEVQVGAVYRDEAMRIIAAHPLRYTLLSGYRFLMLWFDWQVKEAYGRRTTISDYLVMVEQLALLATAALVWRDGAWRRNWPLAVSVVAFTLIHMAAISRIRFIIPVMPLTVSIAALGCTQAGQKARWVPVTVVACMLAAICAGILQVLGMVPSG